MTNNDPPGAIVVVAARQGFDFQKPWWSLHQSMLEQSYNRIANHPTIQVDLHVYLLHLANTRTGEWDQIVPSGPPVFLRIKQVTNEKARPLDQDGNVDPDVEPEDGQVPDVLAYLDLFDDRKTANDQSNSYVPSFGHPPRDFLLAASHGIENQFSIRSGNQPARGLSALGTSVDGEDSAGGTGLTTQHASRTALSDAVRCVRDKYGTISELSEYEDQIIEIPPTPPVIQQSEPHYLIMTDLLDRVATLNGIEVSS